jgi:anti-sigma regulatory factor (Ser/Thr protein kinase)
VSATLGLNVHRHVVELYREDSELAVNVARYLAPGLAAGYPTMIMATPPLRTHFEMALLALDVDLDGARDNGALIELDADELLQAITVDGEVNALAFDQVIGEVARSFPAGTPIPGFGQMVGLLWERGDPQNALELEKLWNNLSRDIPIYAYCGFRSDSITQADGIRMLAGVHDHVVLQTSIEPLQLAPEPTSPRTARRFAREIIERWQLPLIREAVELIVSELVTNAVNHARSAMTLSLARQDDLVRIAVRDASPELPIERSVDLTALSGRGLGIVRSLATDFGTFGAPYGKTIWAHLTVRKADA